MDFIYIRANDAFYGSLFYSTESKFSFKNSQLFVTKKFNKERVS